MEKKRKWKMSNTPKQCMSCSYVRVAGDDSTEELDFIYSCSKKGSCARGVK